MKDFDFYLNTIGEIGFVETSLFSLVYVSGLPSIHPQELVMFEEGDLGQVLSFNKESTEILLLTRPYVRAGSKVVRTNTRLEIPVGDQLLGSIVNPLGDNIYKTEEVSVREKKAVDIEPLKILDRKDVEKPLETGVSLVDLVIPLSKGQRELVIGDRKTGKTEFLLQTIESQAKKSTVCIYAVIGQKISDIQKLKEAFDAKAISSNTVIVASNSSDTSGLIYLTPYTAMTIAEYFRDKGHDVLLVLDDMTTHARNYREISLLARRFPGRSAYPGDIFYIHAKLIERAGNFKKGSITLLPVAESVLGDLSGYIQTNLMAMTDGHIFFDVEFFNEGKKPAVNPFLSVTRVGHQTQTPLLRDISRELSTFLVNYERMKQFLHFGAEVGETARNILTLGEKLDVFFNQDPERIIPINANVIILTSLWSGIWNETDIENLDREMESLYLVYDTNVDFKKGVDKLISDSKTFADIVSYIRRNPEFVESKITRSAR